MKKNYYLKIILGVSIFLFLFGFLGGEVFAAVNPPSATGDKVQVSRASGTNLREGHGSNYQEIRDEDYIEEAEVFQNVYNGDGYAPYGATGEIISGPFASGAYRWWKVKFDRKSSDRDGNDDGDNSYAGWTIENNITKISGATTVSKPSIETRSAMAVIKTGAIINGRIINNNGSSIIERRFDWGTTSSGDNWTEWVTDDSTSSHYGFFGVSGNYFSYYLSGLKPSTTYYFRAWTRNSAGWNKGNILPFTTTQLVNLSELVTVDDLDFGDLYVGFVADKYATLYNNSLDSFNISVVRISGNNDFYSDPTTIAYHIPPGGTYKIKIRFSPASEGRKQAVFKVNINPGLSTESVQFTVTGNGVSLTLPSEPDPELNVYPITIDFGTIDLDDSPIRYFYIENSGGQQLDWSTQWHSDYNRPIWVNISPPIGRITTNTETIEVKFNNVNLNRGYNYEDYIKVISNGGTKQVKVKVKIKPNASYSAIPHASYKCYDYDVYWYDSESNREEKKEECGTSEYTSSGYCYQGNIYRDFTTYGCSIDRCLSPTTERIPTQGCNNLGCNNGKCNEPAPPDTTTPISHASFACYNNDVYWYDSESNREEKKEECGSSGYSGSNYCYQGDVYRNYINRGCSGNRCYPNTDKNTDKKLIQGCNDKGCSQGVCVIEKTTENQLPNKLNNLDLKQYKSNGMTEIGVGKTTNERKVIFKSRVSDPDGDRVRLQVELRRLGEYGGKFDETKGGLKEGELVENGSMATTYARELIDADYHWRVRAIDEHGEKSEWVEFGGNDISNADFSVTVKVESIPNPLTITTKYDELDATINTRYSKLLQADGGKLPYTWSLYKHSSPLPPGLTINKKGVIKGTPTKAGSYAFIVQVKDGDGWWSPGRIPATKIFLLRVNSPIKPSPPQDPLSDSCNLKRGALLKPNDIDCLAKEVGKKVLADIFQEEYKYKERKAECIVKTLFYKESRVDNSFKSFKADSAAIGLDGASSTKERKQVRGQLDIDKQPYLNIDAYWKGEKDHVGTIGLGLTQLTIPTRSRNAPPWGWPIKNVPSRDLPVDDRNNVVIISTNPNNLDKKDKYKYDLFDPATNAILGARHWKSKYYWVFDIKRSFNMYNGGGDPNYAPDAMDFYNDCLNDSTASVYSIAMLGNKIEISGEQDRENDVKQFVNRFIEHFGTYDYETIYTRLSGLFPLVSNTVKIQIQSFLDKYTASVSIKESFLSIITITEETNITNLKDNEAYVSVTTRRVEWLPDSEPRVILGQIFNLYLKKYNDSWFVESIELDPSSADVPPPYLFPIPPKDFSPTPPLPSPIPGPIELFADEAVKIKTATPEDIAEAVGVRRDYQLEGHNNSTLIPKIIINDTPDEVRFALINFITYGTPTTKKLGEGERTGVVDSFKSAYDKLPATDEDWQDIIKIANGRWPTQRDTEKEKQAEQKFKKIYLRNPNRENTNDNAAVMVMTYGLRPGNRNLSSEKAAIRTFRAIYKYDPVSAGDWDIVRAIANSGAVR